MHNLNRIFSHKPLAQAIVLALAVPALVQAADFTPNRAIGADQQPGMGTLPAGVAGGDFAPTATTTSTTTGGAWAAAAAGTSGHNAIRVTAPRSIVTWGSTATATFNNAANTPGGFNIGPNVSFYVINAAGGATKAAVLNIDISGQTSIIAGKLRGVADTGNITGGIGATTAYPDIMISNPNGVVVRPGAVITTGSVTAQDAANAGPATTAGGFALLGVNLNTGEAKTDFAADRLDINFANSAPVQVKGTISGGATAPDTAAAYVLLAGANQGTETVNVANTGLITTNQFLANAGTAFNVAGRGAQSTYTIGTQVDVPASTTAMAISGTPPTTAATVFEAAEGSFVNSGAITDLAAAQQLYAAANGALINDGTGVIAVGGPNTAQTIQLVGKGVTNAGTLQSAGLSILFGSDGVNLGGTVKSFVTTANPVSLTNRIIRVNIANQTDQQGDVNITTPITVHSDRNAPEGAATAYTVTARNTTISAKQEVIPRPGQSDATANRAELHTTQQGGLITIDKNGSLTAGNVLVGSPILNTAPYNVTPLDLPVLKLNGTIATTAPGQVAMNDPNAGGQLAARPDFIFNGFSLTGSGVTEQGGITANIYDIYARGTVNSPVSPVSQGKWLLNGLNLTTRGTQPQVAISAISTGTQAINLNITSPTTTQIFSGVTITPFANAVTTTGTNTAGAPVPNVRSTLLVQSNNALNVRGSFGSPVTGGTIPVDPTLQPYSPGTFYFPGAVVFKSTTGIIAGNIMNAWTTTGIPSQGVFFEAPSITTGWIAMNHGQAANFSTVPGVPPVTYYYALGNNGATVNFLPAQAAFQNTYSALISGTPWSASKPLN